MITPKVRKSELSFLYEIRHLVLIYISTKCHQNIPKAIHVTEQTRSFTRTPTGSVPKSISPPPPHALVGGQGGGGHNDQKCKILCINFYIQLASIGQSDAPLTGDQEVKDSIPAESATFSLRLVIKSLQ